MAGRQRQRISLKRWNIPMNLNGTKTQNITINHKHNNMIIMAVQPLSGILEASVLQPSYTANLYKIH
jgi:hypothetical protein